MCEAITRHDFVGQEESELSFKKNSIVKILDTTEREGWYKAEQNGREGVVPSNYVKLKPNDFMAKVTRRGAKELLKDDEDGAFLIRDSESTPGDFDLSVKFGGGVQHFKVLRDGAGKYFLWVVKFNSLNELPASIHVVLALYDFAAVEEEELSFKKGDKIEVIKSTDPNWWTGKLVATGAKGQFPVTYTKESTE